MTRKQLQTLISAGVFSAALLSGAAYADDTDSAPPSKSAPQAPSQSPPPDVQGASSDKDSSSKSDTDSSNQQDPKHTTKTDKNAADMGCSKASGCGGH
jgi:hypothetical protein